MDLSKLRPIDFRRRLDQAESQAITVRKRRNDALIRTTAGVAAGAGTFTAGMMLLLAVMQTLFTWPLWLGMPILLPGVTAGGGGTWPAVGRYFGPSERRLLPAILEPDAADFLEDHWQRRDHLLEEADAFDATLQALRALPERTGGDEIDAGVLANLAERRSRFEAKAEAYFSEFHAATEEERQRPEEAGLELGQGLGAVGVLHGHRRGEHDHRHRHHDEADRAELPAEVGEGPLLDRLGDLLHLRRARVGSQHALPEGEADQQGEHCGEGRADEDEPLTTVQREFLVAAFGSDH